MSQLGGFLVAVILFVVVLGGLVLVHEIGHFLTARLFRVRVLEFGIGFPPRARILRSKGETLLTLNWLPFGGFVRMEGEDGDAGGDPRSFSSQPLLRQLGILVAGVVMNVVLGFVLFVLIAWVATPTFGVTVPQVQPDSPASRAGIVAGDTIIALDGTRSDLFDLSQGGILGSIRAHIGETITLTIRHADGSTADLPVALRSQSEIDAEHGPLGISATQDQPFTSVVLDTYNSRPLGDALAIGTQEIPRWGALIVGGLGDLVNNFVSNPTAPPNAAGPVGIAGQLSDVFNSTGIAGVLYLAGILSINLAVVNILPLPPLDGGRMLVLVIKRLAGRRISLRAERLTYAIGFAFLLALIVWISGFDIARLGGSR